MTVEIVGALIGGAVLAIMVLYLYMEDGDEMPIEDRKAPSDSGRNDAFRNNGVDDQRH